MLSGYNHKLHIPKLKLRSLSILAVHPTIEHHPTNVNNSFLL
ncbi:hypothetical protein [Nostoc sp. CENA543]|nr:hypothetical protein [Nostoc sp. CENA543]